MFFLHILKVCACVSWLDVPLHEGAPSCAVFFLVQLGPLQLGRFSQCLQIPTVFGGPLPDLSFWVMFFGLSQGLLGEQILEAMLRKALRKTLDNP